MMGKSKERAHYGGQAVIEGVMMRSPRFFAIACRRENKEIVIQQGSVESILRRLRWLDRPFLRGTLALIDAIVLGTKSLMFSADVAMDDIAQAGAGEQEQPKDNPGSGEKSKGRVGRDLAIGVTVAAAFALGIGIFVIAPHLVANLLKNWIKGPIGLNLTEGAFRVALFVGYIAAISLMKDIQRVFQYHGAEHKVINAFESDAELAPENFGNFGTIHPRCGTSFILVVLAVSIVVYSFLGWDHPWYERIACRLLLLPVVAGIAYEVIRFAGRHRGSRVLAAVLAPGLWLQRLTTRRPTDDQVEVALCALRTVLKQEDETHV